MQKESNERGRFGRGEGRRKKEGRTEERGRRVQGKHESERDL